MSALWMQSCGECLRLWRAFDASRTEADTKAAVDAVLGHIVRGHLDRLPARRINCPKCNEFGRARSYSPSLVTPTIAALIRDGDERHRAGHLWEMAPWFTARRAAAA